MNKIQIEVFDCETGEKIYGNSKLHEFFHPSSKDKKIEVPEFISESFQSILRGVVFYHRSLSISFSFTPVSDNQFNFVSDDVY